MLHVDDSNYNKIKDIRVGKLPWSIAFDERTNMIYVLNQGPFGTEGTVSVINGFTDMVTAGAIFDVNPANSGKIICDNRAVPTNAYVYVDNGTNCVAQPNKDFEFNTWTYSPLTSRNSSIPLQSSGNLTVNRYGAKRSNIVYNSRKHV
jgi:DNA-binding beta-propeller fold protein YncE